MTQIKVKFFKTLSRNDTGETKSHQCGISIPKSIATMNIFPIMGTGTLNPKVPIDFYDESGRKWTFNYTYYNDYFWGKPAKKAHNEYRLTVGILKFMRENNIKSGDKVWFGMDDDGHRRIGFCHSSDDMVAKQNSYCSGIKKTHYLEEYNNYEINIIDPNAVAEPTIIKINKNWERVDY